MGCWVLSMIKSSWVTISLWLCVCLALAWYISCDIHHLCLLLCYLLGIVVVCLVHSINVPHFWSSVKFLLILCIRYCGNLYQHISKSLLCWPCNRVFLVSLVMCSLPWALLNIFSSLSMYSDTVSCGSFIACLKSWSAKVRLPASSLLLIATAALEMWPYHLKTAGRTLALLYLSNNLATVTLWVCPGIPFCCSLKSGQPVVLGFRH